MVPEEMEFVSTPGNYSINNNLIAWEVLDELAPGMKLTNRVVVKAVQIGSARGIAYFSCTECSREISDEEGTSVYE